MNNMVQNRSIDDDKTKSKLCIGQVVYFIDADIDDNLIVKMGVVVDIYAYDDDDPRQYCIARTDSWNSCRAVPKYIFNENDVFATFDEAHDLAKSKKKELQKCQNY